MEIENYIKCLDCKHLDRENFVAGLFCDAFPDGIPYDIATGKFIHDKLYEGDNGIIFEADEVDKDDNS